MAALAASASSEDRSQHGTKPLGGFGRNAVEIEPCCQAAPAWEKLLLAACLCQDREGVSDQFRPIGNLVAFPVAGFAHSSSDVNQIAFVSGLNLLTDIREADHAVPMRGRHIKRAQIYAKA